jgi:hypothetical protein
MLRLRRESAILRLALFAAVLALIGGIAALAGAATGSKPRANAGADGGSMEMAAMTPEAEARANGLASSAGGYTFAPVRTTLNRGDNVFRFRIVDAAGNAVREYDVDGGVRLHLIVVRRDFVGYQHLHPRLGRDGAWSVPLRLDAPGAYRAYADFDVSGDKTVLGYDLFVPGSFAPAGVPAVASHARVDGYSVSVVHDVLHAGKETKLHFLVRRDGRPVPSFQAYVGHRGHLVALRAGDLAYSHVHPEPTGAPGEIVFHTELETAGTYRVFLQFKRDGIVHTAPFTVEVER